MSYRFDKIAAMCGLLTFISAKSQAEAHSDAIGKALELIHHRGPDETRVYVAGDDVVLGFKRLSIIDVQQSHQPLSYLDGRYVITFNGEIYNYLQLRKELTENHGATFETQGDTEMILAAYHHWGADCATRLRGMFAFAIWDRVGRVAFGARDQFGIKPLHYAITDDGLYLSSEKKAVLQFVASADAGDAGVDAAGLSHYLTLQYVPEPGTLHADVGRIECGESFTYYPDSSQFQRNRYFAPKFTPSPQPDPERLYRRIRQALEESVELHLQSEVPVGAFLSSGIDSTAIVALARRYKPDILTFTVGYEVNGYSEVTVAQTSANWLGVTTIPTLIGAEQMMAALPRIVWHLDDPVADPSLVPLYFLAKKAAEHVTVVLSGEGSDELFGGYGIYREPSALRVLDGLPRTLQRGLRAVSTVIPEGIKGKSFIERGTTPLEERYYGNARIFTEADKARLLKRYDPTVRYTDVTAPHYAAVSGADDITQMQYVDLFTWLRGDILVKADRISMAHSLELRVPFLDTGVFSVARTIPPELKVHKGVTKYALRRALEKVVPPQIVNRPKLGFPVPTRVWLKDAMYPWARTILTESGAGYLLDLPYVLTLLETHRRGEADHSRKIWTVLVFCVWHSIFVERRIDPRPEPAVSRQALAGGGKGSYAQFDPNHA
ncbi:MAG TPA: asparagine synthase (glutamine-hydrolyzing) [Mycobacteriales bacterium]|jgi:asparagine synthase (glutamine-hydrolysing)|nr:asparagine synthase (glutamine-hydrolyzing) [Mycobacteriales bacterium]